jgi:hypothetical protein
MFFSASCATEIDQIAAPDPHFARTGSDETHRLFIAFHIDVFYVCS